MSAQFPAGADPHTGDLITSIDEMFARLGRTYFEILDVPRSCDAAALRRAYRSVCERFHPDLYVDVELGARRGHLDLIMREATNAFQVLIRPELRAEYERELPPESPAAAPVALSVIAFGGDPANSERPRGSGTPAPSALRAPTPPIGLVLSPAPAVPESSANALPPPRSNSTLKRTPIAALLVNPAPSLPKPEAPPPPPHTTPRAETPRPATNTVVSRPEGLRSERPASRPGIPAVGARPSELPPGSDNTTISSLRRGRAEMLLRNKRQQRDDLEAQANAALKQGDHEKALQVLRLALALEPEDESLARRIQQLELASRSSDLDRIAQTARTHERAGRWMPAAELWAQAAAQQPAEYSYHLYAAHAFCESGNELSKAADLARRATRLRPDAVEAHVCLARIFFRAGRIASARSALEQAQRLAPQHAAVLELARQLRV